MTNPDRAHLDPSTSPLSANRPGWRWTQIGLLSINVLFFSFSLDEVVSRHGINSGVGFAFFMSFFNVCLVVIVVSWIREAAKPKEGAPTPFSFFLRWCNVSFCSGWLWMTFLTLSIPAFHSAQKAGQETARESEPDAAEGWSTFTSAKSRLVVDLPSDWVEATDLDPAYAVNEISRTDVGNDLAFFLLSVPKEDVTYASLDAWTEASLKELTTSFSPGEVVERTEYLAQGRRAIEIRLDGTKDNVRLIILMRFIDARDHYVWARTSSTRSGFRDHEETLRRIIGSVRREP